MVPLARDRYGAPARQVPEMSCRPPTVQIACPPQPCRLEARSDFRGGTLRRHFCLRSRPSRRCNDCRPAATPRRTWALRAQANRKSACDLKQAALGYERCVRSSRSDDAARSQSGDHPVACRVEPLAMAARQRNTCTGGRMKVECRKAAIGSHLPAGKLPSKVSAASLATGPPRGSLRSPQEVWRREWRQWSC